MTSCHPRTVNIVVASALLSTLGLSGCALYESKSMPSTSNTWNVTAAKAVAIATETRIASSIPSHYVAKQEQFSTAHLLSCSGADEYTWPGETTVTLTNSPGRQKLVDDLKATWNTVEGFTATLSPTGGVGYDLEINGPSGASYLIAFRENDSLLKIESFSPCFALPEGNNGGKY